MKKITLFCAGGFSSSLLVNKMNEAARMEGLDYDIHAYSITKVEEFLDSALILVGPQVRFMVPKLQQQFPNVKIADIPMRTYGMMDGPAMIQLVKQYVEE